MSKETIGKIISAVVGLAVMAAAVYMLSTGLEHGETTLMAGLAILGAVGTLVLPGINGPRADPAASRSDDKGARRGS